MQIPKDSMIDIPHGFIDLMVSRSIPEGLAPQKWPTDPPEIKASQSFYEFRSRIIDTIKDGIGFTILRWDSDWFRDPHLLTAGYWNLFTFLAQPLIQYKTGELLFDVRETVNSPISNHYSQGKRGGGFHTDGTFLPEAPLYVGLVCINQSTYGGESILIDGRAIYQELRIHQPHVLENLEKEYHFDCCDQLPGFVTRKKAIIRRENSSIMVQYLRLYIAQGHRKARIPLEADCMKSLDAFDDLMEREEFRFVYKLNPGEMLLFNNHIFFHGRNGFTDDPNSSTASKRWLVRIYGSSRENL